MEDKITVKAKAKGIVILNGVAYTPNQPIPSLIDRKVFEAIKENLIIEEEPKNIVENKPLVEDKTKKGQVAKKKKDEVENDTTLDELFE